MADIYDPSETQTVDNNKHKRRGLWWLLALLILLGLIAFLITMLHKDSDDNTATSGSNTSTSQTSAQTKASLKSQFETTVAANQRTILFNPDTATIQDQASTDAALTKIAAFYKANPQAQFVVNGSIYNGQPGDQNEQLATQRAQLVKQQLVQQGVKDANVAVTAVNTYTGNTDAAQAEYARSVTISVK